VGFELGTLDGFDDGDIVGRTTPTRVGVSVGLGNGESVSKELHVQSSTDGKFSIGILNEM
jgi:hypothetical protein